MKNKKFFTLLFLETLFVLGIAGYFFIDSATIYKHFFGDTKFYEQSQQCDLHVKGCSVNIPTVGAISFNIEPKEIPLMKRLTFTVATNEDFNKDELDLHIFATNMNMGYYNLKMKKISKNRYQAKSILPTCIVGGMIWRAEVVMGSVGGAFTFKTK